MSENDRVPAPSRSFADAWADAAHGTAGFWRHAAPATHFRTSAGLGPDLGEAVAALLDRHPSISRVVDVGAGDAPLLQALHESARNRGRGLRLAGVDLRPPPDGLPDEVDWALDCWDVRSGGWSTGAAADLLTATTEPTLLLAVEWLDDLPCRLAVPGPLPKGWVEVDEHERWGGPLDDASSRWATRWWPRGRAVEVGLTRDTAWSALVRALGAGGGLALMVDYGHRRVDRPPAGSLTGYRDGRRVPPQPEPGRNLTAHVAVDAVAAAGEQAGARTLWLSRQREVLSDLLSSTARRAAPPDGPLLDLAARSRHAALTSPTGLGSHWWLLQQVEAEG